MDHYWILDSMVITATSGVCTWECGSGSVCSISLKCIRVLMVDVCLQMLKCIILDFQWQLVQTKIWNFGYVEISKFYYIS
jgi:hypothetical protein